MLNCVQLCLRDARWTKTRCYFEFSSLSSDSWKYTGYNINNSSVPLRDLVRAHELFMLFFPLSESCEKSL